MIQEPREQESRGSNVALRLRRLSTREQLTILFKATGPLSNREKAEIMGNAGLQLFKGKGASFLIKFLLQRLIKVFAWSVISVVLLALLVIALLGLGILELAQQTAFVSVTAALIMFFVGFLLFSAVEFFSDMYSFFHTSSTAGERTQLLSELNGLEQRERMTVLRGLSGQVFAQIGGGSIIASFMGVFILCLIGALIIAIILILCFNIPALSSGWIATLMPYITGGVAVFAGYSVPYIVQKSIDGPKRSHL